MTVISGLAADYLRSARGIQHNPFYFIISIPAKSAHTANQSPSAEIFGEKAAGKPLKLLRLVFRNGSYVIQMAMVAIVPHKTGWLKTSLSTDVSLKPQIKP